MSNICRGTTRNWVMINYVNIEHMKSKTYDACHQFFASSKYFSGCNDNVCFPNKRWVLPMCQCKYWHVTLGAYVFDLIIFSPPVQD